MITPTARLLLVALAGIAPIGLSGAHSTALVLAGIWLLAVALLAIIDARFTPTAAGLRWSREHEDKLSLGVWNPVVLRAVCDLDRPVRLRVRDAVPVLLSARGEQGAGACPAAGEWSLSYSVFPLHRGDYALGPLSVRYLGPLGLAWRQHEVDLRDDVKVYPNLRSVRSYETLLRRGRVAEIGLRNTRRWGEGSEFERLRVYTPDDEFRRIDWKATARRHLPIVVDYQLERNQTILLALDTGRLMANRLPLPAEDDTVPNALTRLDHSLNAALLLTYAAQEYGDRVGLLAFSDRVSRWVTPRAGRPQLVRVTEEMYNLEPEPTATDFIGAIGYLATRNPRRSLIVFFTDIAEPDSARELVGQIGHLVPRHLPLVVTMQDPSIRALAALPLTSADNVYRRAVATRLLDSRAEVLLALKAQGALTLDVPADRITPSVINRYLEVKARSEL
jgi:uncharacterized protein (DUF58 family)